MSRIAKNPVLVPKGVAVSLSGQQLTVTGPKGSLTNVIHDLVSVSVDSALLSFSPRFPDADRYAGTARAIAANMVTGVSNGFQRKLELVGVGYRAQAQGKLLNLTLGFSHPVAFQVPDEITVETPSATEIVIKGTDSQLVGQVAAKIRRYRPPEPYKGKGVKYAGEVIVRKEAKKK